ncbi:MAG: SBBP repeat-containing protein [Candidatus Brocadia sinica]|nr:SBBP repeat-containing protein [Candidatus Brocadia sinica]NUO05345.1 SBBP repeat-containing protein [Candidatus Brocadia sinica]
MKRWNGVFVAPMVMFVTIFLGNIFLFAQAGTGKPSKEDVMQKAQKLRMPFIANEGQTDKGVAFYAQTFGGTVFVTKDGEIVYALPGRGDDAGNKGDGPRINVRETAFYAKSEILDLFLISCREPVSRIVYAIQQPEFQTPKSGIALKEELVGGKINEIQGMDKTATKVSYFKGSDASKWKQGISTYDVVTLGEVYKGIDVTLKAYGNNVEKLFCVKPGANSDQIKIKLGGARELRVNKDGQLEAETELGPVKFTKPVAYQEIDGKKVDVEVDYTILNPNSKIQNPKSAYGFKVASYDKTKDLIIDPLLASTFLGEYYFQQLSYNDTIALDASGNVYVTGETVSSNFPTTPGAYDTSIDGFDVFVSKLDGGLTTLLASTFLGGSQGEGGPSLVLDTSGNVYVTGGTYSSDFPTTPGAYDTSFNSYFSGDAFISKLDGGLTTLLASTFLGGYDNDGGSFLVLDASGNVYVTGGTYSSDFPTTPGAYDTSFNSYSSGDAFISKLDGGLTTLLASTFLGGSNGEVGSFLALDTSGNVYVTGDTASWDFPTTPGAYDTSFGDGGIFISKLNGGLTTLLASTFLSGSDGGGSRSRSLALDTEGNVYVTGETYSSDFPTTPGAYDTSLNETDAFISKLNGGLTTLLASTFLGGYYYETGQSLALDTSGNVYVMGFTMSPDFPTTQVAYDTSFNGYRDFFISKLDGNLSAATTAIELASFEATVDKGAATLFWETATEVDNAGFNLYRAKSEDGDYAKINDTLIPARGNAVSGANYSFVDTPGKGTFYYKLEDVDYNGASAMHGPEKVRVREGDNAARHSKKARR